MKHNKAPNLFDFIDRSRLYLFSGTVYAFASICAVSPHALAAADDGLVETTMSQLADEQWMAARNNAVRSGDPTLARLYEWMLYRNETVTGLPFDRVAGFVETYKDWPEITKIQMTAERVMPNDYPHDRAIDWFQKHPPVSAIGFARLLDILQSDPHKASYGSLLITAWPKLRANNNEQAELLERIGRSIPLAAHNQRIDRLLRNEQYTLARNLAAFLGQGYPELVEARIGLAEDKPGVNSLVARVPAKLFSNPGFILDRVKWREDRDDDKGAIALLNELPASAKEHLTFPEDWWKERSVLARRMIEARDYQTAYNLVSRHYFREGTEFAEAEWFSGWLALRFLNRPEAAQSHFIQMYGNVGTAISKARGAYWAGRAAEKIPEHQASASTWFEQAAAYSHTYYGQLALRHLKRSNPVLTSPIATPEDQAIVARSPLIQAALELRGTSYEKISASFLSAAMGQISSPGVFQVVADELSKRKDVSGAYRVAKAASWKNVYLGTYYTPSLLHLMEDVTTDKTLIHAIIRQESQFDTNAVSPSGALGLSQLMPPTAKEVADKNGWDFQKSWLTSRPTYNIRIGAAYMGKLLERFDGSYPLAIAAYNAGPRRVSEWLEEYGDPRNGKIDWIDWLEMIPVAETRNYVQRVTEGVVVYRQVLPKEQL